MNISKIGFCFLVSLIFLTVACKKEELKTADKNIISVILLPTITNDTIGDANSYTLRGIIVSPQKVAIKDHGFRVVNTRTSIPAEQYLSLGWNEEPGDISVDFFNHYPLEELVISAYAVLKNGDTIRSDGDYGVITMPIRIVSLKQTYFSNGIGEGKRFECDILNNNPGRYRIIRGGIQYSDELDYPIYGYTLDRFVALNAATDQYHFLADFYSYYFSGVVTNYRMYMVIEDNYNANLFYVYSEDRSFTN